MAGQKRRTKVQSVALNEYLQKGVNSLVETGEFSTASDVIVTALTEFLVRQRVQNGDIFTHMMTLLNRTDEGGALIKSICNTDNSGKPTKKIVVSTEDYVTNEIPN